MAYFEVLREKINRRLRELQAEGQQRLKKENVERQIHKHKWVYGALGQVPSDTMFICENPSLAGIEKAEKDTIDGGPPDIEAQWWGGRAKLFRQVLYELELKESPPSSRGGWRCYLTNVVKEANYRNEQRALDPDALRMQAEDWREILLQEIEKVGPKHVFALGHPACKAVAWSSGYAPLRGRQVHYVWHYSTQSSPDRVAEKMRSRISDVLRGRDGPRARRCP